MSSLRRDLVERKLWMVVALLLVAVAAVPVLLLKSAAASTTPTVPAPPAATPAGTQTSTTKKVDSKESAKVVLARIARNPFASAVPKLSTKPASPSSSATSTSSTSSTSTSRASSVDPVVIERHVDRRDGVAGPEQWHDPVLEHADRTRPRRAPRPRPRARRRLRRSPRRRPAPRPRSPRRCSRGRRTPCRCASARASACLSARHRAADRAALRPTARGDVHGSDVQWRRGSVRTAPGRRAHRPRLVPSRPCSVLRDRAQGRPDRGSDDSRAGRHAAEADAPGGQDHQQRHPLARRSPWRRSTVSHPPACAICCWRSRMLYHLDTGTYSNVPKTALRGLSRTRSRSRTSGPRP